VPQTIIRRNISGQKKSGGAMGTAAPQFQEGKS
jgi:hypothetical protein